MFSIVFLQVYPVCLPEQDAEPLVGELCTLIGWGNTLKRMYFIKNIQIVFTFGLIWSQPTV